MHAILLPGAAVLVLLLDQASKVLVLRCIASNPRPAVSIVFPILNSGPAPLGVSSPLTLLALWTSEALLLLLIAHTAPPFQTETARVALGIILGGVSGNAADRLWRGGVVDFVNLRFWPVFNLADAAIVSGVLLVILSFA